MSNPSSPSTPLQLYEEALNVLILNITNPSQDCILKVLAARELVQKQLELETDNLTVQDILSKLIELDSKLKKEAHKLDRVDFFKYGYSLSTNTQAWLLEIEKTKESDESRFEWWLKGIRVLIWTINIALFSTLADNFLTGGSGFLEVALLAFPGIKSLLEDKKEATKREQKSLNRWLKEFKNFPNLSSLQIFTASFLSAVFSFNGLFLLCLGLIFWQQPFISNFYKNIGINQEKNQNLVLAEQNYLKAIAFDAENYDAHYKLGFLYEELQEFDKAQKEYLIAIRGKELSAYNNLAYWYIRQDKALEAISLLQQYENLIERKDKQESQALKYSIAKNRGWAKFKAKQYEEARDELKVAIRLAEKDEKSIRNPGSAYCLYAKALEVQIDNSIEIERAKLLAEVQENWQQCKDLIQKRLGKGTINTEEYQWLYEAKQKSKDS